MGVFVNRNFRGADRIGVLMLDERDRAMLDEIDAILGGVKVTLRVADAGLPRNCNERCGTWTAARPWRSVRLRFRSASL